MTVIRFSVMSLALGMVLWLAAPQASAQVVKKGAEVSETVTIEAIDYTTRMVTIKDSAGNVDTVLAGPEVKRFAELKVGDKVTFRYYESVVVQIRKPGEKPAAAQAATLERSQGPKPGGTISQQQTAVVTLEAIDPGVPSVTIRTADGRRMSMKIEDKKNLEGFKVGDQVEITYTQALAISVESPKK